MFSPEFSRLKQEFSSMLRQEKLHTAAQIVVLRDGKVLVDHAEGTGQYAGTDAHTPFLQFSVSKVFTGLCVHKLIEEGRIELDAPVAKYWPEFGYGGKETATIRHVFLHQAGIPAPHRDRQVLIWPFWPLVTHDVARTPAQFSPGSMVGYHLVNYGFILGEVVRRVTGLQIEEYFRRTFAAPLQLRDTWLRLPKEQLHRTPRLSWDHPALRNAATLFNLPAFRTARIPAAGMHSTARDLATVFQMLLDQGGCQDRQILRPETVDFATSSGFNGWDSCLKSQMNWGHGFILGGVKGDMTELRSLTLGGPSTERTFAGLGLGTCMVWADKDARLVTAFTCNGMQGNEICSSRWSRISNAVWEEVTHIGTKNLS
jgi:CubicO group peptidase (beta-lactamase class C family)